jgi:hypothetical protein
VGQEDCSSGQYGQIYGIFSFFAERVSHEVVDGHLDWLEEVEEVQVSEELQNEDPLR